MHKRQDDNDGVLNKDDACANTPTDTAVDEKGCAKAPVVTKAVSYTHLTLPTNREV